LAVNLVGRNTVRSPQLRTGGGWKHLPELTPEPDSTGGEN
jgi:hypothetical protein